MGALKGRMLVVKMGRLTIHSFGVRVGWRQPARRMKRMLRRGARCRRFCGWELAERQVGLRTGCVVAVG